MAPHRPLATFTTLLRPTHHLKPHNLHCRSLHQSRHLRLSPIVLLYRQQESYSTSPSPSSHLQPHHPSRNHRTYSTPTFSNPPSSTPSDSPPPRPYTHEQIQSLLSSPSYSNPSKATGKTLLIDVREPSELSKTGRIPGALSMPLTSNPDAFHLGDVEFLERFGWEKPRPKAVGGGNSGGEGMEESPYTPKMKAREARSGLNAEPESEVDTHADAEEQGTGTTDRETGGVEEVVFYCRAGVRSRAAARLAREWKGIRVGDMTGGWLEWEGKGGEVER